jgi:hypothetical protein
MGRPFSWEKHRAMADIQTAAVAVAVPAVAVIVWLVRLEGRINLGESRQKDINDDLNEIKADLKKILMHLGGVGR